MKKSLLYTLLACGASLGFIGWRVHAMKTRVTPHYEIVEDFSLSHARGCSPLLGLADRVLNFPNVSPNSTLTVLAVGDQTTADEPWRLAQYPIPQDAEVLEGRTAKLRRQQEILLELRNRCQSVRRTTISPIFLAVKQAVADLRAQGCKANSGCALFVDSDLEENVEPSIRRSLYARHDRDVSLPSINNAGISIMFCGLAVRVGRIVGPSGREIGKTFFQVPGGADRLRQIWRALFTKRKEVKFEPYCPIPTNLNGPLTAAGTKSENVEKP